MPFSLKSQLNSRIMLPAALGFLIALTAFWLQGRFQINLADEGYLWYGSWRTWLGEIPVRDFRSYDPGRYLWASAWFRIWGDSLLSLRAATAVFQGLGLAGALVALKPLVKKGYWLVLAGLLLALWGFPRHKLYDLAIATLMVAMAARLLADPSLRNHFLGGVFVGAAALFGRNHGVYGLAAFLLVIGMAWFKLDRTRLGSKLAWWAAGIAVGFIPMLAMYLLVPGFFQALLLDLRTMIAWGHSNTPLPIPWPWTLRPHSGGFPDPSALVIGLLFLLLPVYYGLGILRACLAPRERLAENPLFTASLLVGVVYLHYAFSRADAGHLAHAMPPAILGAVAWPFSRPWPAGRRWGYFSALLAFSLVAVAPFQPGLIRLTGRPFAVASVCTVGCDTLVVDAGTAELLKQLNALGATVIRDDQVLIAPHWPLVYVLWRKRSPVREIYFVSRETRERQDDMIAQMEAVKPRWAVLGDVALDGSDALRFRNTHAWLYGYLQERYHAVPAHGLPGNYQLLRRND